MYLADTLRYLLFVWSGCQVNDNHLRRHFLRSDSKENRVESDRHLLWSGRLRLFSRDRSGESSRQSVGERRHVRCYVQHIYCFDRHLYQDGP